MNDRLTIVYITCATLSRITMVVLYVNKQIQRKAMMYKCILTLAIMAVSVVSVEKKHI